MRKPFTQIYLHCVWSTWDRLPLITPENEKSIYAAILAKCHQLECDVIALGGVADHVHLLIKVPPSLCISDVMREIKGSSSHLMSHHVTPGEFFKWQGAYGVYSISQEHVPRVKAYIERQKQHHAEQDLQPEWEITFTEG